MRNLNGLYKLRGKSFDVLRSKEFKKVIFKIVGAKSGTGAQKGAVIWELKCKNSKKTFWAIPIGTIDKRRKLYKDYHTYIGNVSVKYLDMDENGCITRNPIIEEYL